MKVGILGGSFDPIHNGHLLMAQYAIEQLQLDQVIFLPTFKPPHKMGDKLSKFSDRVNMLELAFDKREDFVLSTLESERPGLGYTYDSLKIFAKKYPGAELFFLIGSDSLMYIEKWYRSEDLLREFFFGVAPRPGRSKKELEATINRLAVDYGAKIYLLDSPYIEISSTGLRQRVKEARPLKYHLPESVEEYIYEQMLYK